MNEAQIARINELYHKSKAEGLTEAEKKEQKMLRMEYIKAIRASVQSQLDNADIEEPDGTIVPLKEKRLKNQGKKKNRGNINVKLVGK